MRCTVHSAQCTVPPHSVLSLQAVRADGGAAGLCSSFGRLSVRLFGDSGIGLFSSPGEKSLKLPILRTDCKQVLLHGTIRDFFCVHISLKISLIFTFSISFSAPLARCFCGARIRNSVLSLRCHGVMEEIYCLMYFINILHFCWLLSWLNIHL